MTRIRATPALRPPWLMRRIIDDAVVERRVQDPMQVVRPHRPGSAIGQIRTACSRLWAGTWLDFIIVPCSSGKNDLRQL